MAEDAGNSHNELERRASEDGEDFESKEFDVFKTAEQDFTIPHRWGSQRPMGGKTGADSRASAVPTTVSSLASGEIINPPPTAAAEQNLDPVTSSPERGFPAYRVGDDSITRDPPARGASSTYLGSLTSASEIFSPIASGYPSSTSLQSSQASRESSDANLVSTVRRHLVPHQSEVETMQDAPAPPAFESHSSSSTSTQVVGSEQLGGLEVNPDLVTKSSHHSPTSPSHPFKSYPRSGPGRLSASGHLATSPTRSGKSSPVATASRSADQTPSERSPDPFRSLSRRRRHEESSEELHEKGALLQPNEYPEPKETYKLVKDSDPMGNKRINDYKVLNRLGTGAHGTVKRGRNVNTDQDVAIKIVRRYPKKGRLGRQQETPEDKVKKEIAVLKKCRHPHVVSLLEVIDDEDFGKVYLILEFVERGEIVWRKQTSKDIATFEANRIHREMEGNVDEAYEAELLARFNEKHAPKDAQEGTEDRLLGDSSEEVGSSAPKTAIFEPVSSEGSATGPQTPLEPDRDAAGLGEIAASSPVHMTSDSNTLASHSVRGLFETPMPGFCHGSYAEDDAMTHASDLDYTLSFQKDLPEWNGDEEEYRYVPCLSLTEARDVFRDTLLGLEYLHFHRVVHRDIKPANLLWTADYRVKISDFGVSYLGRPLEEGDDDDHDRDFSHVDEAVELAKTVGTPAFYAPELCDPALFDAQRTSARPTITGQIDIWALGVTLYAMVFGRLPFFDKNEFAMYEKIGRQDVFVPSKRLRGVDNESRLPVKPGKREDHAIEYESVEDTLRDLLRRLLCKDPLKRITLKEVKRHPWVLEDIPDPIEWIDRTDPSKQKQPIQVSQREVQDAVAPLTLVERVKSSFRRLTSVVRGRDQRKRAESATKDSGYHSSTASASGSGGGGGTFDRESRRPSLKGEDMIYSALRAAREAPTPQQEHPLSQSTLASPVAEEPPSSSEFVAPIPYLASNNSSTSAFSSSAGTGGGAGGNGNGALRPTAAGRTASTADSVMTVRVQQTGHGDYHHHHYHHQQPQHQHHQSLEDILPRNDSAGSSSSISRLLGNTGRRIARRVRSRDPGRSSRGSSNFSSRASSTDNLALAGSGYVGSVGVGVGDDAHVPAVVGFSPATALGHVNAPPLPPDINSPEISPPLLDRDSSHDSLPQGDTPSHFHQGNTGGYGSSTINRHSYASGDDNDGSRSRRRANTTIPPASPSIAGTAIPLAAASAAASSAIATGGRPVLSDRAIYVSSSSDDLDAAAADISAATSSEQSLATPRPPPQQQQQQQQQGLPHTPPPPASTAAPISVYSYPPRSASLPGGRLPSPVAHPSPPPPSAPPTPFPLRSNRESQSAAGGNSTFTATAYSDDTTRSASASASASTTNPAKFMASRAKDQRGGSGSGGAGGSESLLATGETITPAILIKRQAHAHPHGAVAGEGNKREEEEKEGGRRNGGLPAGKKVVVGQDDGLDESADGDGDGDGDGDDEGDGDGDSDDEGIIMGGGAGRV